MNKITTLLTVLSLMFFSAHPAQAETDSAVLTVKTPVAFATTSVQKNGAVFFEVTNTGDTMKRIISAQSPVSKTVELHTHEMDGDMMMMREVEAYDVPAKETITLQPMGHHIMLMGLVAPLKLGETFPLILNIENAEPVHIDVEIKAPGSVGMSH